MIQTDQSKGIINNFEFEKINKKMKTKLLSLIAVLCVSLMVSAMTEPIPVKPSDSKIAWKGYKVTGSHEGVITLKSGNLSFDEKVLTGGSFTIDMKTIFCTDLKGESKGKLEGHLKSDDFFAVEKFPEATLVFTSVKGTGSYYDIVADLTVKGNTKSIQFNMTVTEDKAYARLRLDRSEFDVKYGSNSFFENLADRAIYDDFDLDVMLSF